ncbi:WD repeat and FYVE domain-containing [Brachionus plicatilis]|uniref:WD repeat and FYVE domain-containing n=1 Tax=Brachionus plicatilis TaxID=10195 RepID=A0A3M7PTZ3_BRAPC|nr:WD repeat and FYVE domain-containing [Brachionus plicatilis]
MPVSKSVESLGGAGFLLTLVAMATDVEFMYPAVKCLACVVKSNIYIHKEMEHGNQLHVLNLTFSLTVCDDDVLLNQKNFKKFIRCTNNAAWLHAVNSDTSHTTIDFAQVQAIHDFQLIQANFCKYPHLALLFDAHKININQN